MTVWLLRIENKFGVCCFDAFSSEEKALAELQEYAYENYDDVNPGALPDERDWRDFFDYFMFERASMEHSYELAEVEVL